MRRLIQFLFVFLLPFPLFAQESALFPRFAVTASSNTARFDTNVRIDSDSPLAAEGTRFGLENDLGLEQSKRLTRFAVQWAEHDLPIARPAAS